MQICTCWFYSWWIRWYRWRCLNVRNTCYKGRGNHYSSDSISVWYVRCNRRQTQRWGRRHRLTNVVSFKMKERKCKKLSEIDKMYGMSLMKEKQQSHITDFFKLQYVLILQSTQKVFLHSLLSFWFLSKDLV